MTIKEEPGKRMALLYARSIVAQASKAILGMTGDEMYIERIMANMDEIERCVRLVRFNLQKPK